MLDARARGTLRTHLEVDAWWSVLWGSPGLNDRCCNQPTKAVLPESLPAPPSVMAALLGKREAGRPGRAGRPVPGDPATLSHVPCGSTTRLGTDPRPARMRRSPFPEPALTFFALGSPPPARGPEAAPHRPVRVDRFTPACARPSPTSWPRPVHPRLRGDQEPERRLGYGDPGSPRLRGDQNSRRVTTPTGNGSPPPARGPGPAPPGSPPRRRFTPACAGTSLPKLQR